MTDCVEWDNSKKMHWISQFDFNQILFVGKVLFEY